MFNYKQIQTKLAVVVLSIALLVLWLGLMPLDDSIDKQAKHTIEQDMQAGERILVHLLQENAQSLKQSAKLLATDDRLHQAVREQDELALERLLSEQQQKEHVHVVYFIRSESHRVTGSKAIQTEESEALLALTASKPSGQLQFLSLQQTPYQLVAVEVKSPVVGWLILGKKLDQSLVSKYQSLNHAEISLIQKSKGNHWQMVGSTLSPNVSNKLVNAVAKINSPKIRLKTMEYNDVAYQLISHTLHHDKDTAIVAIIQSPITAQLNPIAEMKWAMLGLLVLALSMVTAAMAYVSKVITKPMAELIENTKEIAKGNYLKKLKMTRKDELGQLSQAINEMGEAVALREEMVHELAFGDELTGLANRLAFMQALNKAIQDHEKAQTTLSVLVMNIERFKQINITLGRDFGDEVLRYVGKALNQLLPLKQGLVARLDADEFAVVLYNADQEKATNFASELCRLFEQPVQVGEQQIDLDIGIGIAFYPTHASTEETLLHQAETAQQTAKQKKTDWIVYNSALEIDHTEKLKMMTELKEAIKNHQLVMYLQPKVNTKTRALVGAEALVRWVHPSQGMMFPEQFIPFVEHTPTMSQITYWMIEEACKVMMAFKQQLIPLNISVNLSTRDLNNLDLPNQIQKRMEAHGLSPKALHLEITEDALMADPVRAASVVRKLSELGIHISIDDFGTGYSSLSYLRELPVKEIKIDQSFVKEMHRNASDKAIVRSTIDLGHHLGLKVVAEGIESEETIKQLAALGCDEGQGYYISKPMPVRDFGIWLERWNNQISQLEYELELEIKGSPLDFVATPIRPTLEIARETEMV
jgi:diguanylate cyclase